MMKLSKDTLKILENFQNINEGRMVFYQGNQQRITELNWLAEAEFEEEFPIEFGIYDLKQFLAAYKLFKDPTLEFDKEYCYIKEDNQQIKYRYCDPSLIRVFLPRDKQKKNSITIDDEFIINKDLFSKIKKAAIMFNSKHIAFESDGSVLQVKTVNPNDPTSSFASFDIGKSNKIYKMVIDLDRLKMLEHDYRVQISETKIIQFYSQNAKLNYLFGCEAKESTYTG